MGDSRSASPPSDPRSHPPRFPAELVVVVLAFRDLRLETATVTRDYPDGTRSVLPRVRVTIDNQLDLPAVAAQLLDVEPLVSAPLPGGLTINNDRDGASAVALAHLVVAPGHAKLALGTFSNPAILGHQDLEHVNAGREAATQRLLPDEHVLVRLLQAPFTLRELRLLHESLQQRKLDPANFAKRILATPGLVSPAGTTPSGGRPASSYVAGPAAV